MIYWFTGQPSHGKTVLANLLKESLLDRGFPEQDLFRIDGDEMRDLFTNKDYSMGGRVKNIDAAQKIAHYLHNQGKIVIVSLVSPYLDQREEFKETIGEGMVEFYVHTSEPRERDHFAVKGYQAPQENFVDIDTTKDSPEESLAKVLEIITYKMNNWNKTTHVESSLPPKEGQFAMFVGRWQPLHEGHQTLFKQAMDEGKNILICIRDIEPNEKNPFSASEVKQNIETHYADEVSVGKVKVMVIPDICSIEFGRGVGYDIIERIPPQKIGEISATKIREEMKKRGEL